MPHFAFDQPPGSSAKVEQFNLTGPTTEPASRVYIRIARLRENEAGGADRTFIHFLQFGDVGAALNGSAQKESFKHLTAAPIVDLAETVNLVLDADKRIQFILGNNHRSEDMHFTLHWTER
jgi:hypothetical protein